MTSKSRFIVEMVGVAIVAMLLIGNYQQGKTAGKQQEIIAQATQRAKEDAAKVVSADKERDSAKAQADGSKGQAEVALAQAKAKDADIAKLKAKLAAMKPQAPATDEATLPQDAKGLAASYTEQGYPPTEVGDTMGWPVASAVPMLGLIIDGKQYPSALGRIEAMGQEITLHEQKETNLTEAVTGQTKRADSLDVALAASTQGEAACKDEVVQLQTVVDSEAKIIKAEKHQKWTWGAVGIAAGWGFKVLVLHWPF